MNERALVVDGDEETRASLARVLHNEGYEVVVVATGRQGLAATDEQPFTLVVLDYHMADMHGGVFVRTVLGRHPHIHQVLLTRPGQRTVSMIGVPVLRKPIERESLLGVLERHCGHVRRSDGSDGGMAVSAVAASSASRGVTAHFAGSRTQ